MKKLLAIITFCLLSQTAYSANWTGYGLMEQLSQQPASTGGDFIIVANLPDNPTSCAIKSSFHITVTTEQDKRNIAMLLSAFMTGRQVRLYVSDECHTWGIPEVTGVYVKY